MINYQGERSPLDRRRNEFFEQLAVRIVAGAFALIFGVLGPVYVHSESWNEGNYVRTAYGVVMCGTLLTAWIAFRPMRKD